LEVARSERSESAPSPSRSVAERTAEPGIGSQARKEAERSVPSGAWTREATRRPARSYAFVVDRTPPPEAGRSSRTARPFGAVRVSVHAGELVPSGPAKERVARVPPGRTRERVADFNAPSRRAAEYEPSAERTVRFVEANGVPGARTTASDDRPPPSAWAWRFVTPRETVRTSRPAVS
jgi:hypothetical protein